jgi:predicted nicotinamide N-methyase
LGRDIDAPDLPHDHDGAAATKFVRSHTTLAAPLLVPEIRLHLADEAAIRFWERNERELSGLSGPAVPFWAFPWVGGQVIARHLLDNPDLVAGCRVLDVACGSGIGAIAAAMAGAASVTASEIDPVALAAAALNAEVNGVEVTGLLEDVLGSDAGGADVVLAGDLFYEEPMARRVLPFLLRARQRGAEVLVGDPGRAYLPRRNLRAVQVHDVTVDRELEGSEVRRTTIWQLTDPPQTTC